MTTEEKVTVDIPAAKKVFSRIGFALCILLAVSYGAAFILEMVLLKLVPEISTTLSLAVSSVALYGIGVPVFYLFIRKITVDSAARGNARPSTMLVLFAISVCLMYAGSFIGAFVYEFVGENFGFYLREGTLEIVSEIKWYEAFVFTVLIAPFFEELIFRKLITDRIAAYGEKLAIIFTALTFAFFHSSIQQFFYAFFAGLVFGYVYIRTRRLIYPYILHALMNFFGSVAPLFLMEYVDIEEFLAAESTEAMMEIAAKDPSSYAALLAAGFYGLVMFAIIIGGFVLMPIYKKKLKFEKKELELPRDTEATVAFTPIGVILFIAVTVALPVIFTII